MQGLVQLGVGLAGAASFGFLAGAADNLVVSTGLLLASFALAVVAAESAAGDSA